MSQHRDLLHRAGPTLAHVIDLFLQDVARLVELRKASARAKGRSPATLAAYKDALQAQYLGALLDRPMAAITRLDVRTWHLELAMRPNAQRQDQRPITGMADMCLRVLRTVYSWAIDEELLVQPVNPCLRVRRLHLPESARALSIEELEAFRAALPIHLHYRRRRTSGLPDSHLRVIRAHNPIAALQLLDFVGARAAEVLGLRLQDVDLDQRLLHLERTKTHDGHARPLAGLAVEKLRPHLIRVAAYHKRNGTPDAAQWVFPMPGGKALSYASLYDAFQEVAKVAGLAKCSPHGLRSTFVSHCYAAGVPEVGIQGAVGHKRGSSMTWERYRKVLPASAWSAAETHAGNGRAA